MMPNYWKALFFVTMLLSSVLIIPLIPLTLAQVSPVTTFQSPKKQIEQGLSADHVRCNESLVLMKKLSDNSPACVKPQTAQKLVERGWGMLVSSFAQQNISIFSSSIKVNNTNFTINYDISGSGNKLLDANQDVKAKSLVLSLETISDGTLTVSIPRAFIDAKLNNNQDDKFFVLVDGQEISYVETNTTDTERILSIPFEHGSTKIEIIGTQPI